MFKSFVLLSINNSARKTYASHQRKVKELKVSKGQHYFLISYAAHGYIGQSCCWVAIELSSTQKTVKRSFNQRVITLEWWHSFHTNQHFVEGSLIFIILFVLVLFDFRCRLHCRSRALNLPFLIAGEGDSARVTYCFSIKLLVSSLYKLWMVEFPRKGT